MAALMRILTASRLRHPGGQCTARAKASPVLEVVGERYPCTTGRRFLRPEQVAETGLRGCVNHERVVSRVGIVCRRITRHALVQHLLLSDA
jgi:hypothetical protein